MVQNAVALFYAGISHTPQKPPRKGNASRTNAKPRTAQQRRALEQQLDIVREGGWQVKGNQTHNLPTLFGIPTTTVNANTTQSTKPHKEASKRTTTTEAGTLRRLAHEPILLHIFKFLELSQLSNCALGGWRLALWCRPIIRSRALHRLQVVEVLESRAQKDTTPSMAEAEQMVSSVRRSDIDELRKVTHATAALQRLFRCVALCFGVRRPSWRDFLVLAKDTSVFCQKMTSFDRSRLTTRLVERLAPFVHDSEVGIAQMVQQCRAAGSLCTWVHGVYAMGAGLYKPWETDRTRARLACRAYLDTAQQVQPERLTACVQEVATVLASAGELTTCDTFGYMLMAEER